MKPIRCFLMIKKDSNMICIEKADLVLEVLIFEEFEREMVLNLIFEDSEILEICWEECFEVDLDEEQEEQKELQSEQIWRNILRLLLKSRISE